MLWLAGALGAVRKAFSALLGLVTRYPLHCAIVAPCCLSLWFWHGKREAIERGDALVQVAASEIRAHRQTKANYRVAQEQAAALESARLARVKADQEKINADVSEDYRQRLADLRARYDRLRAQSGTGIAGTTRSVAVPSLSTAASGTDEAPTDGLSWQLKASEQAIQLDALIDWVQRQATVQVN